MIRNSIDNAPELKTNLEELREKVDVMDRKLIDVLSERFEYIKSIGKYKRANNLAVFQKDRWKDVTESRVKMGTDRDLSEEFMRSLLSAIHEESIKQQEEMLEKDND